MSVTIELSGEVLRRLEAAATARGVSVEDTAAQTLAHVLVVDAMFASIVTDTIEANIARSWIVWPRQDGIDSEHGIRPTTDHERRAEGSVGLSPAPSTIDHVAVTLDLPAEAQARLQAEATRRGMTLDQLVAEIADSFPAGTTIPKHRLGFVGIGASALTGPFDIHQERADLAVKKFAEGI